MNEHNVRIKGKNVGKGTRILSSFIRLKKGIFHSNCY